LNNVEDRISQIRKRNEMRKKKRRNRLIIVLVAFVIILIILFVILKSITMFFVGLFTGDSDRKNSTDNPETTVQNVIKISSSTDSIPEASVQNDMLQIIKDSGSSEKVCYLTFDDGPNTTVTPQILDILRRYNVKATFFQVGSLIEENYDMAQRVFEEGHLIGGHSYDHTYSKIYSSSDGFMDEMNQCNDLINEIMGDSYFPIIRFPGGSYNSGTYGSQKQEYKKLLAENGIYHCDWNALNGDAEGSSKTPEQLLERTIESVAGQSQVVVLMHDTTTKKNTVKALPEIIEYFISEGYIFERLDRPVLSSKNN